jgi:hypothetical protein
VGHGTQQIALIENQLTNAIAKSIQRTSNSVEDIALIPDNSRAEITRSHSFRNDGDLSHSARERP